MPYIDRARAAEIDAGAPPANVGELNYKLTTEALAFAQRSKDNYETRNAVMGVFASAQAEFYRRFVAPYEDKKITENGDVYPGAS